MGDNQLLIDPGLAHRHDLFDGDCPRRHLPTHLGGNRLAIAGVGLVHLRPDRSATEGSDPSSDCRSGSRAAQRVSGDGTQPSAAKAANQGPLIGVVRGSTPQN
jgi:hypothetical protein